MKVPLWPVRGEEVEDSGACVAEGGIPCSSRRGRGGVGGLVCEGAWDEERVAVEFDVVAAFRVGEEMERVDEGLG